MMGEYPPLPPDFIEYLKAKTSDARLLAWEAASVAAIVLFEGWSA